ncbi:MAG: hypothetical protein RBS25_02190 [Bacilli bacterium]|jgi:hypothetical protein|nr:hypothetical protein [Bacilli bacterium]
MAIIIRKYRDGELQEQSTSVQFNSLITLLSERRVFDNKEADENMQLFDNLQKELLYQLTETKTENPFIIFLKENSCLSLESQYLFLLRIIQKYLSVLEKRFIIYYPAEATLPIQQNIRQEVSNLLKKCLNYPNILQSNQVDYKKIEALLGKKEETFPEMLFRLIDQKERSDVEVYRQANIDRRLFSKIKSNQKYHPSKQTAIAFAIALQLNWEETVDFLKVAGYSLVGNNRFDIIICYLIQNKIYQIDEINTVLVEFNEKTLGLLE